jgi:hypothetical protein
VATQSVIVQKRPGRSREDAERIAKRFGKIETSRETGTSYRFRQRPPEDFAEMRTKKLTADVSIVTGPLKKQKR